MIYPAGRRLMQPAAHAATRRSVRQMTCRDPPLACVPFPCEFSRVLGKWTDGRGVMWNNNQLRSEIIFSASIE
jgi:hypothetical protein